jgi:hypothetical protein
VRKGSNNLPVISVLRGSGDPAHFRVVPTGRGRVKLAEAKAAPDATFNDVYELIV